MIKTKKDREMRDWEHVLREIDRAKIVDEHWGGQSLCTIPEVSEKGKDTGWNGIYKSKNDV